MKKFRYYIIGVCVLLSGLAILYSCEDRIDKKPLGDTEVTFFTTQDNFDRGIQGIYASMTNWYWYNSNDPVYDFWLLPGDDLTTRGAIDFETFAALQPGTGHINYYWQVAYRLNGRANTMLDLIDKVAEGIYTDADMKNYHRGEALFMRALVFYRLWSYFGTAPIVTERITGLGEQTKPNGSTGTQMLDQAITDLTEAASLLPDSWADKFIGRATKNAAWGMLGKCYVTRACYGGGDADYSSAIDAFGNISNAVQLTPNFGDNFDAWNENNVESLFEFQASNAPVFENIWLSNDFNQQIGAASAYWGFFYDTWSFWAHTPYVPTQKLMDAFEPGDPRIAETFEANAGSNFSGWAFVKYTKRNQEGQNTSSLNNPRILRYADVLLLQAEAELQAGSAATALDLVNQIRERARNSATPASAVPADLATVTMQDIMDERLRELAGEEGDRFLDLKRWHAAGYINLGSWTANDWGPSLRNDFAFSDWFTATEGDMLYPIPTSDVDLNPNVTQNKGY